MGLSSRVPVLLFAAVIFLGCVVSPPSLMDDVDAANAHIARTMLESGDWVTAHLDGVPYLEKPPLHSWLIAISYRVFGVRDWAARIPLAMAAVALCWLTASFGAWAFGSVAGAAAGLILATSAGLFLFTRILIADTFVALSMTASLASVMRALDPAEGRPGRWAVGAWIALGAGFLAKGLIALVFPGGIVLLYLALTGSVVRRETWRRLRPALGVLILLAISAPWVALATWRNPPYFAWTMESRPGQYHGFFWLFFINEHLLRFLNLRYPRDYDTVPPVYFWLLHLVWLFPWSAFAGGVFKLGFRPVDRAGRARLLALCWAGVVLLFFTFSTTQEYYSLPAYPALALLLGCAVAAGGGGVRWGLRIVGVAAGVAAAATAVILIATWTVPAPGDISAALVQNPDAYRLSLGHLQDLRIPAFAYLRTPLLLACIAFLAGAVGVWLRGGRLALWSLALMMLLFTHAARLALVVFDPYMSSRPLAEAIARAPAGALVVDEEYYAFSSVFYYLNRTGFLLNGRINDLEYGSYAPSAPPVFIGDRELRELWASGDRCYLVTRAASEGRFRETLQPLRVLAAAGGKLVLTNR